MVLPINELLQLLNNNYVHNQRYLELYFFAFDFVLWIMVDF